MEEIFIEFRNVSKKYKEFLALDKVSFSINKGDVFGYIGPNGAGKTTTIKILVGLIRDYKGKVLINGEDLKLHYNELSRILGYHPQEVGFQSWRTVNHTLTTFGKLSGLESEFLKSKINEILEFVNLKEFQDKKVVHLSGGMVQKLRLAQALLSDPEILILDEPLSGLDPMSRYQLKNLVKQLGSEGKTILFSSHILSDVQDVAIKIGILHQGKIKRIGTPTELQLDFHIGNIVQIIYAKDEKMCEELEELEFVEKVELFDQIIQKIHLKSNFDVDICMHHILKKIINENCKFRNISLVTPSLEEVYLNYVGGKMK
ncbi:MAG: ABC transporter ATP-binding protein [Candidatus Thorarchaeota archaeon]